MSLSHTNTAPRREEETPLVSRVYSGNQKQALDCFNWMNMHECHCLRLNKTHKGRQITDGFDYINLAERCLQEIINVWSARRVTLSLSLLFSSWNLSWPIRHERHASAICSLQQNIKVNTDTFSSALDKLHWNSDHKRCSDRGSEQTPGASEDSARSH